MSGNLSPIPWTGNKACIFYTLNAFMPPHKTYLEACCGSAEVFFRKQKAEKEILNDFNSNLINFLKVLRNNRNLERFFGKLCLPFNSEELFRINRTLLQTEINITDEITQTSERLREATEQEINYAVALLQNQVMSFSSTGQSYGIAPRDMRTRIDRLRVANMRLCEAIILNRDYKDAIDYAAAPNTFIFLDPPYRGTEDYYENSSFDKNEHDKLFEFMHTIDTKFNGKCKFLITYNNDPYIRALADNYGFDMYVQKRLHNMRQSKKAGDIFEELIIGNYDLLQQAEYNEILLPDQVQQLSLFDVRENEQGEIVYDKNISKDI